MKNTLTYNDMKNNPIEELRNLTSPVSEQEWAAIVNDSRYVQKFGGRPKMSPRGRAALIAGVAASLIAIPILFKTLTDHEKTTTQGQSASIEAPALPPAGPAAPAVPSAGGSPASVPPHTPEYQTTSTPNNQAVTKEAANQERRMQSTVAEARQTYAGKGVSSVCNFQPPLTRDSILTTPERVSKPVTEEDFKIESHRPAKSAYETEEMDAGQQDIADDFPKNNPAEESAANDEFFIPSAFTPNGDGLNDLFYVNANFEPKNYEIFIYSRGGDLMFTARDIRIGWDGKMHGRTLPHGVYPYIIKFKDSNGNEQTQQGQVLLIP